MSSRIIRGDDRTRRISVGSRPGNTPGGASLPEDRVMVAEKLAFEQGYGEGERIGKQMGERMMETAIKRYDRAIEEISALHASLAASMETETVKLSMEIARKIVQRELRVDPDLVTALVSVALRRAQGHQGVAVRISSHDFTRIRAMAGSAGSSISVKEDSALDRGDFVVDTVQTHIDGRLSSQLETIGRALFDE